jgi:GntP family gluconate:H+ symporter
VTLAISHWLNRRMPVPVRPLRENTAEEMTASASRSDDELPSFLASIAPVVVPMGLIAAASVLGLTGMPAGMAPWVMLLGNKNVALLIGAILAFSVLAAQIGMPGRRGGMSLGRPIETAAVIILIISAGGAYGASIQKAGIGEAVRTIFGADGLNYVILGWVCSAVMRAAQGSATIATIAAVGIVTSIAGHGGFGVNPLYVLVAIGFGSKFLSWMNDPGFWLISRIGGLTQGETLRSWTVMVSITSMLGLAEVLALSHFFPRLPGN